MSIGLAVFIALKKVTDRLTTRLLLRQICRAHLQHVARSLLFVGICTIFGADLEIKPTNRSLGL